MGEASTGMDVLTRGGDLLAPLQRGVVSVAFQPVVDLRGGSQLLHSLECLARPAGVRVSDLFRLLREGERLAEADFLCLEAAVRSARALPSSAVLNLNVSGSTPAVMPHFALRLLDLLATADLDPRRVILDLLSPWDFDLSALAQLQALRSHGLRLAVDDVGLTPIDTEGLLRCQPDFLKIDRTVVHSLEEPELREALLTSYARLSRSVGAQPVAEGVESLDDLDAVAVSGISLVQGHYLGAPMTVRQVLDADLLGTGGWLAAP